jgi:hypothetical protein
VGCVDLANIIDYVYNSFVGVNRILPRDSGWEFFFAAVMVVIEFV